MGMLLGVTGGVLWVFSAYSIWTGLNMETGFEGTANLQLMHVQSILIDLGIGGVITGAILIAAASIIQAPPK